MSDPDATDLVALTYCSTATFEAAPGSFGVHPEVNRILMTSRRNNRACRVGGMLHFGNGYFFQYLEGPAATVDALYGRIQSDARHRDVEQLTRGSIERRRFSDWSMKFVVLERIVEQVLERADMSRFDPYRFTPEIIEDLIVATVEAPEADASSDAQGPQPASAPRRFGSLLGRLLGRSS